MTISLIQNSFNAGELAPGLWGRSDLEKYDFALKSALNLFPNYRGGISNRPGTEWVGEVFHQDLPVRLAPFSLGADADGYVVILAGGRLFFVQSGGFVLESAKPVISVAGNPDRFEVTGHGYADDDLIFTNGFGDVPEINKQIYKIVITSANHFRIYDTASGAGINSSATYISGGTVRRLYSIINPFTAADFQRLRFKQDKNTLTITHPNYPVYILTRVGHTNWTLAAEAFGPSLGAPTNLVATPSSAGAAGATFSAVAVGASGEKSIESVRKFLLASVDYTLTAGFATLTWSAVAGAVYYEIYRSRVSSDDANAIYSNEVGFIGRAFAPEFVDTNIIPDFTQMPKQFVDPFAAAAIIEVTVSAGGTLYAKTDTVAAVDVSGTDFSGRLVINDAGVIIGVFIRKPGSGYIAPTFNITTGTGSGATLVAVLGPASGLYPSCSAKFQQRWLYAGSESFPTTIYASRPGQRDDFSTSIAGAADDAYTLTIDDVTVSPIQAMLPMQAGLIVFTPEAVWLMRGQDRALVPESALIDPQTYKGIASLDPLVIDTDIIYLQKSGTAIRSMTYNFVHQLFVGTDRSILSSHLIRAENPILFWAYAPEPFSLVKCVCQDGTGLALVYVKEFDAFGWTRYETDGFYRDVVSVTEGAIDRIYFLVEREVGGIKRLFVEREHSRLFETVEDAWFVDCGLRRDLSAPAATLSATGLSGTVTLTASAAVFVTTDVGEYIYAWGTRLLITVFNSSTTITATFERPVSAFLPQSSQRPPPAPEGEWEKGAPTSTVGRLWHLEGRSVVALADGSPVGAQVVVGGEITLPFDATKIIVGLGFKARGEKLPLSVPQAVMEHRRKIVVGLGLRVFETLGMTFGRDFDNLISLPEFESLALGEIPTLRSELTFELNNDSYSPDGAFVFEQALPLPMTLTQIVFEVDVGDDTD